MKCILSYLYHCLLFSSGYEEWSIDDILSTSVNLPIEKPAQVDRVKDFISIMDLFKNDLLQKYLKLIRISLSPPAGNPLLTVSS